MSDSTAHKKDTVTADGLFIREFRPTRVTRGAFLLLHGMESHSRWFGAFSAGLVAEGWAVIAYDRAGWGKSPGRRGHMSSYRHFVESAARIATNARQQYGAVHLAGMSWGGMAALYLAMRRGWLFDSVACMTPGLAARRDIPFSGKLRIALDFFRHSDAGMVEPVFHPAHFTKDPSWQQFIANDPDRIRSVSTSFCLETLKMRRFIKETAGRRLLPPTLCLLAGDDEIIDNQKVGAICRRAGALVEELPGAAHTLIFERPEQTVSILARHAAGSGEARSAGNRKVWIIGPGAVGGAITSLLSFGGVRTGALVKPAYLQNFQKDGFTLRSNNAVRSTGSGAVWADTPEGLPADPDLAILAVKSFDTDAVLSELSGKIPPGTVIASLQNGVGNEEKIAAAFPNHTIIAAAICASLELAKPGQAIWADDCGGLAGALHRGDPELAKSVWQNVLCRTGMECRWIDSPNAGPRVKWSKLMLNVGFNALNSITGQTSAQLLRDEVYGSLAVAALREGFAVMDCMRLDPVDLPGFPVSKLRMLVKMPFGIPQKIMAWQAGRSPEAAFSMRQDVLKKRQYTEIQELNGKITETGRALSVSVPANAKLVEMVEKFRIKT